MCTGSRCETSFANKTDRNDSSVKLEEEKVRKAPSQWKKDDDGRLGRGHEGITRFFRSKPYRVRDGITFIMIEIYEPLM